MSLDDENDASGGDPPTQNAEVDQATAVSALRPRRYDLDIQFDFDSDRISGAGAQSLDILGAALKDEALQSVKTIVLEGHTDARGGASYNETLSQKRAESARKYLSSKFHIPIEKIDVRGKGFMELADPSNPTNPINRRVRVIVGG